jgi:hypothetical protein
MQLRYHIAYIESYQIVLFRLLSTVCDRLAIPLAAHILMGLVCGSPFVRRYTQCWVIVAMILGWVKRFLLRWRCYQTVYQTQTLVLRLL